MKPTYVLRTSKIFAIGFIYLFLLTSLDFDKQLWNVILSAVVSSATIVFVMPYIYKVHGPLVTLLLVLCSLAIVFCYYSFYMVQFILLELLVYMAYLGPIVFVWSLAALLVFDMGVSIIILDADDFLIPVLINGRWYLERSDKLYIQPPDSVVDPQEKVGPFVTAQNFREKQYAISYAFKIGINVLY